MWVSNKRPHSLVYSVKRKGIYSGKKVEKSIKHYKKLLKREEVEGSTLWIQNAKKVVLAKFRKYSINPLKI